MEIIVVKIPTYTEEKSEYQKSDEENMCFHVLKEKFKNIEDEALNEDLFE